MQRPLATPEVQQAHRGPRWLPLLLATALAPAACAGNDLALAYSPQHRIDVIVVPGCPTQPDGALSRCLKERVVWAAYLWEQGLTRTFIVSGAATYDHHVEAEALAAGMVALGVPAARIVLEPHARHTDENVYYALLIMKRLHLRSVAVASHGVHASGGCSFLESWGQACVVAAMDTDLVEQRLADPAFAAVHDVRVDPVADPDWQPVGAYEAARERRGGPSRPSSAWLYTVAPLRRLFGSPWIPVPPPDAEPVRYSEVLARGGG